MHGQLLRERLVDFYHEELRTSSYPDTKGLKFVEFVLTEEEIAKIYQLREAAPHTSIVDVFSGFFGEHYGATSLVTPPVQAIIVVEDMWAYKVRQVLEKEGFVKDK